MKKKKKKSNSSKWKNYLVRMVATAPLANLKVTIIFDLLEGRKGFLSGVEESNPTCKSLTPVISKSPILLGNLISEVEPPEYLMASNTACLASLEWQIKYELFDTK